MTQPPVHAPNTRQQDPPEQQGAQPEAAPAGPAGKRNRGRTAWRRAAVIAAAGVPVGLLWWLLAPSGLNLLSGNPALGSGTNTEAWLPRDLVLAGLFLLAGCIAGGLSSGSQSSGSQHQEASGSDVVLAVLAGAAGALIAWGTGVLCGAWWGAAEDTSANASIAFSLRSYAVLAIWPAAVALSIFLATVFAAPRKVGPPAEAGPQVPAS